MSIDPGIKNFCFSVEDYSDPGNSLILELENTSLATSGQRLTDTILNKITEIIRKQFSQYNITNVLIEKQIWKNPNGIRIMQHIWTLINILHPTVKLELYPCIYKTQVYGQRFNNYTKRKKWSVTFAKELMTEREDFTTLKKLSCKKADDMADCILMTHSWNLRNTKVEPEYKGDKGNNEEKQSLITNYFK